VKYEPKKMIDGLDLMAYVLCIGDTLITDGDILIAGTDDAYCALGPFLANQIEMAVQFGAATKTIHFRRPTNFSQEFEVPSRLMYNNKPAKLHFIDALKIKTAEAVGTPTFTNNNTAVDMTCSVDDLKVAITSCELMISNRAFGRPFLGNTVRFTQLGDWLGID
jgi:hypothetical protein